MPHELVLAATVKNPLVPLLEWQPQIRAPCPHRTSARRRTCGCCGASLPAHGRQHLRGRGPAAGRRHEQLPYRPGQAKRISQQLGGVLASSAVDASLKVTDRPRTHLRRFGQLLLSQPCLGPQLPQHPAETQRSLPGHQPSTLRKQASTKPYPKVRRGPSPPPALGPFPRRATVRGRCARRSWPCSYAAWDCRLPRSRMTGTSGAEFRQRVQVVIIRGRRRQEICETNAHSPIDCSLPRCSAAPANRRNAVPDPVPHPVAPHVW